MGEIVIKRKGFEEKQVEKSVEKKKKIRQQTEEVRKNSGVNKKMGECR